MCLLYLSIYMIGDVPQAMKRLLSIGRDSLLHAVDDSGRTALHLATQDEHEPLMEYLASRGSNSKPEART